MRIRVPVLLGYVVGTFALCGCGRGSVAGLDAPEQLILYSIDGRDFRPGEEPKVEEKFHGYPVLGKVEITDADKRHEIATALKDGLAQSDGKMAKCFWPRHGIRVVEKGRTIEYVICFECYQLVAHEGDSQSVKPVTRDPQSVFDRHLTAAGIPLAPPGHGWREPGTKPAYALHRTGGG
jgi:hypothetical protein